MRLASSAASRAARISASLRLRSVMSAVDQHEAAAWHRVVADFDHPPIRPRPLEDVMLVAYAPGNGEAASQSRIRGHTRRVR